MAKRKRTNDINNDLQNITQKINPTKKKGVITGAPEG
jgi:hypothetical protein